MKTLDDAIAYVKSRVVYYGEQYAAIVASKEAAKTDVDYCYWHNAEAALEPLCEELERVLRNLEAK